MNYQKLFNYNPADSYQQLVIADWLEEEPCDIVPESIRMNEFDSQVNDVIYGSLRGRGNGSGYGDGYSDGYGSGIGRGFSCGDGYGYGDSYAAILGFGGGNGYGRGWGNGVKLFQSQDGEE